MGKEGEVFKPRNIRAVLALFLLPLIFFSCVIFTYFNIDSFKWNVDGIMLIMLGSLTMITPSLLRTIPREIIFQDRIIVKRYMYKDLIIEYDDVVDMGTLSLIAKNGSISFSYMRNSSEVIEKIDELIKAGKIRISGELREKESRGCVTSIYSLIPVVAIWLLIHWIFDPAISEEFYILIIPVTWVIFYKLIDRMMSERKEP